MSFHIHAARIELHLHVDGQGPLVQNFVDALSSIGKGLSPMNWQALTDAINKAATAQAANAVATTALVDAVAPLPGAIDDLEAAISSGDQTKIDDAVTALNKIADDTTASTTKVTDSSSKVAAAVADAKDGVNEGAPGGTGGTGATGATGATGGTGSAEPQ